MENDSNVSGSCGVYLFALYIVAAVLFGITLSGRPDIDLEWMELVIVSALWPIFVAIHAAISVQP